jgi:4-hydroxy-tetrahydrodipicolinate synthase
MEVSTVRTFRGVHSALVTPFDEQDRVDESALAALVEDQIGAGLHGVAVNGSTGEFASLTPDERRRTVEVVAAAAAGRVPMTVQVGAMTTRESVSLAEHAAASGAACLLLVAPYYEPLGEDEVVDHFAAVAEVGPPVMIYNNPSGTGWSMSPELIARLAEHDNIRFLKDTTGDARRLFRVRELCGDNLELLNGQDTLALLGFLAGAQATVWGAPNAVPEACLRLWQLTVDEPDLDAARALWKPFYPVNRFFEENGYMATVKAATCLRGVEVGRPRRPIAPLGTEQTKELQGLLAELEGGLDAVRSVGTTSRTDSAREN